MLGSRILPNGNENTIGMVDTVATQHDYSQSNDFCIQYGKLRSIKDRGFCQSYESNEQHAMRFLVTAVLLSINLRFSN